jgi:hypothetical protein
MNALDKLNFVIATYGRLFIGLFNPRLWLPFAIYLVVMALLVVMIVSMFSPLLSGWVIPILSALSNDGILHYPQHLAYLPYTFQMVNLLPSLLLESVLTAAAMLMFVAYFERKKPAFSVAIRSVSKYYLRILAIWAINVVLIYLLFRYLPQLFNSFVLGSPRVELALQVGMQGLSALLSALFIYAIPYLVIRGRTLVECFVGSFRMFFRNFFTTCFFVAIPQLTTLLIAVPLQRTDTIVTRFNPEVIVLLTFGLVILLSLVNFFTTGSIVRFFLEASED